MFNETARLVCHWRTAFCAMAVSLALPYSAYPDTPVLVLDVAVSNMLIDRGEQIGERTLEVGAGIEAPFLSGAAYAGLYRLTPFGPQQDAFEDEFDYTVGYAWEGNAYTADFSANWLTYPGEESDASLELVAAVGFGLPFQPELLAFADAHTEDWGLELVAGPSWQLDQWELSALGRAGFIDPDIGTSRSYGGFELNAAYALSGVAAIGGYLRAEWGDEASFVDVYTRGRGSEFSSSGVAVGVSLSLVSEL